MFLTFEVIATFGVSATISFTVSSAILLLVAAKRGLLGSGRNQQNPGSTRNTTALLPPSDKAALTGESTPLQAS